MLGLCTDGGDDGREGTAPGEDSVEDGLYLWGHGYAMYDADGGPVGGLYETVLARGGGTAATGPAVVVVHGEFRVGASPLWRKGVRTEGIGGEEGSRPCSSHIH